MKHWMRRAASLLLALVLAAGMDGQGGAIGGVYETQYGESGKGDTDLKIYNENDPSTYSDSVQWTLDGGVATISGQGSTANFGKSPFSGNRGVEAVVVEEGGHQPGPVYLPGHAQSPGRDPHGRVHHL